MLSQITGNEESYKLILSDDKVWEFSAVHEMASWLEKFAGIMGLKKDNFVQSDHKLLFLALNKVNVSPENHIDHAKPWSMYKQGTVYRLWSHSIIPENFIELNPDYIDHEEIQYINMWSSLKILYRHYVNNNGMPVHATLAELDGKGILIAASGGTGKSTCAMRLPEYWKSLSDDTALIINTEKEIRVHPMPTWSDHLWNRKYSSIDTSYSVPLKAIFFLEQADCDEVIPLQRANSLQNVLESTKQCWESYWDRITRKDKKEMLVQLFNTSYNITQKIPCFILKATLNGKFWKEIEKVI